MERRTKLEGYVGELFDALYRPAVLVLLMAILAKMGG